MPIKSLQQRLTQVGVIRLGEKRIAAKSGNEYPAALDSFRITSPSRALVDAVAAAYGGQVKPWQSPSGPEFEVVTAATEIPVFVPPQAIDPNNELWGNGFRSRMCDGEVEKIRQLPCMCEAAARQRYAQAGRAWPVDGKFERTRDDCKPTTRMSLMLADIPSMGTLKLEAKGWNAASELPTLAASIAAATQPIPALLKLDKRGDKKLTVGGDGEKIESRNYVVPILDFFGLFTPAQAFGGAIDAAVRTAVGAGEARQAIGSTPASAAPAAPAVDWLAEIAAADTAVKLTKLRERMQGAGVRDRAVVDAWKARGQELVAASQTAPAADSESAAPAPPPADVVDAEVEPDSDATWTAILKLGKERGWNLPAVEERYRQRMGHDPAEETATGWKLAEFLKALQSGEVK